MISAAAREIAFEQPALRGLLDALRDAATTADPSDGPGSD